MLFDVGMHGSTGSVAESNTTGAIRVSDQEPKPVVDVTAAAHEVGGGKERVPDRPEHQTPAAFLEWAPKYYKQCMEDGHKRAFAQSSSVFRRFLELNK